MRKNEGRTVGLYTKVSPEEKEVIDRKMALLGTMNLRAYLRKMAVDGYVVQLDMSSVVELVKLLRSISSNVNQIARRCNSTRNLSTPRTWKICARAIWWSGRASANC